MTIVTRHFIQNFKIWSNRNIEHWSYRKKFYFKMILFRAFWSYHLFYHLIEQNENETNLPSSGLTHNASSNSLTSLSMLSTNSLSIKSANSLVNPSSQNFSNAASANPNTANTANKTNPTQQTQQQSQANNAQNTSANAAKKGIIISPDGENYFTFQALI